MTRKAFTVAEANAMIPTLERILEEIRLRMESVAQAAERLQILDLLWGSRVLAEDNPDYGEAKAFRVDIAALMGEIEELVEEEVQGRGLRFPQGGLEHGLIDFPTTWEGRWVYLCWHLGEDSIEAWHEIDAGFAGRQSLTPDQAIQMGRDDGVGWVNDRLDG